MIVIETELGIDENGKMSFAANVLGLTKDIFANQEKHDFETYILPTSVNEIENIIKKTKGFNPAKHNEFIAQLLNVIVKNAKNKKFILTRIGQNEKYPLQNQLEFKRL